MGLGRLTLNILKKIRRLQQWISGFELVDTENCLWDKLDDNKFQANIVIPPVGDEGSGSTSYPCKIINKEGPFYNVTEYENGLDATSTGETTVNALQLALADTLPADTIIIVSPSQIGITGGGDDP